MPTVLPVIALLLLAPQIVARPQTTPRIPAGPSRLPLPKPTPSPSPRPDPRSKSVGPSGPLRAELARQASVKKCLSERGQFKVLIRGLGLSASGSDVDQIYGSIYARADTVPLGVIASPQPGWDVATIWRSAESVDLGKYPLQITGTAFGRAKPFDNGEGTSSTTLSVVFDVYDEDGARGGSDDEFFYVNDSAVRASEHNAVSVRFMIPSCQDAPSFDRQSRIQVVGTPRGGASGNAVTLYAELRIARQF